MLGAGTATRKHEKSGVRMTNPNGSRWDYGNPDVPSDQDLLAGELVRSDDGRWTNVRQTISPTNGSEPATAELAVTRRRVEDFAAGWEIEDEYDAAFEAASTRFFDTDPGNRLTYAHLLEVEDPEPEPEPLPEPDPRPVGYGDSEPLGYGDREPVGYGDRDPLGYGDREPVGYGDRDPLGYGDDVAMGYDDHQYDPALIDDGELTTGAAARRNAIEWAVVLVAAVLLALVLRALVLQAFYIPSPSMEDTLLVQDRVLVNKLSYRFGDVGRGDIVVFHRTEEEIALAGPGQPRDVIKRVIALGGETIEIRNSTVFINDHELVEPYLDSGMVMADFGPLTVPEDSLFVMGDNRNLSSDSRGELGPIVEDRVVGRAFVLFWPVDRLGRL